MRWIGVCLGILMGVVVYGEGLPSPNIFLQDAFDRLTSFVQPVSGNVRTTRDLEASLQQWAEDLVDFTLIAQLSVGRSAWTAAASDVQSQFVQTFKTHIFDTYLSQFLAYKDVQAVVTFGEPILRSNKAKVPCRIQSGASELNVAFKVYSSQSNWKIYDVDVDGVSLVSAFRMQFSSRLKDGTLSDLTRSLAEKNRS
jgi:phospholipid transport system substrate-binding protein